jgi:hypothetical protein
LLTFGKTSIAFEPVENAEWGVVLTFATGPIKSYRIWGFGLVPGKVDLITHMSNGLLDRANGPQFVLSKPIWF